MGIHSNDYHKAVKPLYRDGWKPPDGDYAVNIDGSNVAYEITPQKRLGYGCFAVDPNGIQSHNIKLIFLISA